MADVDYEKLDPGIREFVRFLNLNYFKTCDSGDGSTKPSENPEMVPYDDYLPYPHAVVKCDSKWNLIEDVDSLVSIFNSYCSPHNIDVQGNYDGGSTTIIIVGEELSTWDWASLGEVR